MTTALSTRFVAAYKLSTLEKKAEVATMFENFKNGEVTHAEMLQLTNKIIAEADKDVAEKAKLAADVARAKEGGMSSTDIVDSIIEGTFATCDCWRDV